MTRFGLVLLFCLTVADAARAELSPFRRGVNFDIWIEWRSIAEMLDDPAYLETYPDWRREVTPTMYRVVAEEGFDFVRLPMDPGPLLAYGPGPGQDALVAEIREAALDALAVDLKVIVDLHPLQRGDETGGIEDILGPLWPDYVALVGRIAAGLADLPTGRVALEPLNEPTHDCEAVYAGAPAQWPDMMAKLHTAIRGAAPDLTVVLSGACWGGVAGLEALDPAMIADDNVLWSFHSYAPFTFTHQGAVWDAPPLMFISGLPYPPSRMTPEIAASVAAAAEARMLAETGTADTAEIAAVIADYTATPDDAVFEDITRAAAWADAHGLPRQRLILGEFGALHTAFDAAQPRDWYHAFLADKRSAAETAGIGWAVYNHYGDMGVAIPGEPDRRLAPETCRALGLLPCS
jgi:endoglucanase